jgi:hypothetical protein
VSHLVLIVIVARKHFVLKPGDIILDDKKRLFKLIFICCNSCCDKTYSRTMLCFHFSIICIILSIFRMSYEDFCHYFTSMDICHMINMSFFSFKKTWREGKVSGTWKRPDRAGGCGNHSTFLNNPQVN